MPLCLNNPNASFKGTEPSPKGLGFCARAEPLGSQKLGRDGRLWIVKATKKGIKRWVPVDSAKVMKPVGKANKFVPYHERMLATVVDKRPVSFRMVIGYYHNGQVDDTRPFATKDMVHKFAKSNKMWNYLYTDIADTPVTTYNGHVYRQKLSKITQKYIKRIKVLSAPVHNPNLWERITGKHGGWVNKPDLVMVVDVVNLPVVMVSPKDAKYWAGPNFRGMKSVDDKYWHVLADLIRHVQNSGEGWINHLVQFMKKDGKTMRKESEPFQGQFRLVQMGPLETTHPDYRKFR